MILLLLFAYLLGSIPFGLIIAKAHGVNLREIGSGNIGATNVNRALGKKWAYLCFALDVLKGMVPVLLGSLWIPADASAIELSAVLAVGCAAVAGHVFPIYLKFKGGKGVATSFGVAIGFWPYFTFAAVISFVLWIGIFLWKRYVSLASILASAAFPIALLLLAVLIPNWRPSNLFPLHIVSLLIPTLIVLRHRENIKRLLNGTENKGKKK